MSFDIYVVAFGLSRVLAELKLIAIPEAYSVIGLCFVLDAYLFHGFLTKRRRERMVDAFSPVSLPPPRDKPDVVPPPLEPVRRRE